LNDIKSFIPQKNKNLNLANNMVLDSSNINLPFQKNIVNNSPHVNKTYSNMPEKNVNRKHNKVNVDNQKFNKQNTSYLNRKISNSEILRISIKFQNQGQEKELILRQYDNIILTVSSFLIYNQISESIMKPLIITIINSLDNISNFYNSGVNNINKGLLENSSKIWNNKFAENKDIGKANIENNEDEHNITSISEFSNDSENEGSVIFPTYKLNKSY
jgi:hypothetical protein